MLTNTMTASDEVESDGAEGASLLPAPQLRSDEDSPAHANREPVATVGMAPPEAFGRALASLRLSLATAATSATISHVATALVILNMVLMCLPYEGMDATEEARLEAGSTLITWIFVAEMQLKLLGLGCSGYWSDGWNMLDGSIVTMSMVEMAMSALASGTGVKLSFLRMLRMLR